MPILKSLKIRYKSQPAVTTKQGHQKRRMRKIGCKKHFCSKVIFSSQGKNISSTFRCQKKQSCCHRWIQRRASAVTLASALDRPRICWLLLRECWMLQCTGWYGTTWAPIRKSQGRALHPGTVAGLLSVKFGWFSTVNLIYCTMSGCSSTLVPCISSKVLFSFGPKQQTVISFATDGKRD